MIIKKGEQHQVYFKKNNLCTKMKIKILIQFRKHTYKMIISNFMTIAIFGFEGFTSVVSLQSLILNVECLQNKN